MNDQELKIAEQLLKYIENAIKVNNGVSRAVETYSTFLGSVRARQDIELLVIKTEKYKQDLTNKQ